MSMELRVLAIGPFGPVLMQCLDHPAEWWGTLSEGDKVALCVAKTITRSSSDVLAEGFGAKVYDYGTHYDCKPDLPKLVEATKGGVLNSDELEIIVRLESEGFCFVLLLDA
jgi:hypothetical protein